MISRFDALIDRFVSALDRGPLPGSIVRGAALDGFKRSFPCHGLDDIGAAGFEFTADGDVIDVGLHDHAGRYLDSADYDGPALLALASVAWRWHTPQRSRFAIAGRLSAANRRKAEAIQQPAYRAGTRQSDNPNLVALDDPARIGLRLVGRIEPGRGSKLQTGADLLGWYDNDDGESFRDGTGLMYGEVYALPAKNGKHRLVPGYSIGGTDLGPVVDLSRVYTVENHEQIGREVGYVADSMAQHAADDEKDYRRAFSDGEKFDTAKEEAGALRKSVLARLVEFRKARTLNDGFPVLCSHFRKGIASDVETIRELQQRARKLLDQYKPTRSRPLAGAREWSGFCDGAGLNPKAAR